MKLETRYAEHPSDMKHCDTAELRRRCLFDAVFIKNEISLCYTHTDRMVFGGAHPDGGALRLEGGKDFGGGGFLERRELGLICVAGEGAVAVDGEHYAMKKGCGLYIGKGTREVLFSGSAKFYMASTPAHAVFPTVFIPLEKANPRRLGAPEAVNVRTIYQYVHPAVCRSCQLVMGMTVLEPGSVWNTMPCHTHERRMEVYFYFDLPPEALVFHLHGQPDETRHIVVRNEEAVISPSWSIHAGAGTAAYTFIWAMAGENQTFDDMDPVSPAAIR
jgi:4-deoxy-L-threo-5-hexosulose-uronate ketol-isomerase